MIHRCQIKQYLIFASFLYLLASANGIKDIHRYYQQLYYHLQFQLAYFIYLYS